MRKYIAIFAIAVAPLLAPTATVAHMTGAGGPPEADEQQRVVVESTSPRVCRQVRRTGSRMRTARVCRSVEQAANERDGRSQDEILAEAADTLDLLGERISTGNTGGMGGNSGGAGPY